MSIVVDPGAVGGSAVRWRDVASDAGDLHNAIELAVAAAATSAGNTLVLEELTRFWSRWGSSVAARMADLGVLAATVGDVGATYASVESTIARRAQ